MMVMDGMVWIMVWCDITRHSDECLVWSDSELLLDEWSGLWFGGLDSCVCDIPEIHQNLWSIRIKGNHQKGNQLENHQRGKPIKRKGFSLLLISFR